MALNTPFGTLRPSGECNQPQILAVRFSFGQRAEASSDDASSAVQSSSGKDFTAHNSRLNTTDLQRESFRQRRFKGCNLTLYHRLECGHRIRTNLVEDCKPNCLEPLAGQPFFCLDCINIESDKVWKETQAQHDTAYPPISQMTAEQYNQWYDEHRQLQAIHSTNLATYTAKLRAECIETERCGGPDLTPEDLELAAGFGTLGLSAQSSSHELSALSAQQQRALPGDTAEQLHWAFGQLSCGQQTAESHPLQALKWVQTMQDEDEEL